MLAYLVLVGRDGAPVDESVVQRFDRLPASVPFESEAHIRWQPASRAVTVLAWQAFADLACMGSHWDADEHGLAAFAGHCWPRATGWNHASEASWAAQLRAWSRDRDLLAATDALYGQFSIVSLDAHGAGTISTDFGGFDPVFVAHGENVTAISNRAGLCALAVAPAGAPPTRSLTGAGWVLCHTEMFFDGESSYWDVDRLPLGAHVAIRPGTSATVVEPPRSPLGPRGPERTYPELLDAVERDLRESIRRIAELPLEHRLLGLSGGRDSRLLTAAIRSEGVQNRFRFITGGPPQLGDAIGASLVARHVGLDWTLNDESDRPAEDARAEACVHTALTEGMMNGWNPAGSTAYSNSMVVSGLAGEYLRWGKTSRAGMFVTSEAELQALLRRNIRLDPLGLMQPEALAYYRGAIAQWASDQLERGERPQQVASYFNQSGQARHRFAITHAWNERPTLTPFVTPTFVRANQQLPLEQRPDPRFQFDLMQRFAPDLAQLPFVAEGWLPENVAHVPDAERYLGIPVIRSAGPAGRNWRTLRYRDHLPFIQEILLDRANPIYELIDPDRVERALPTGDRHAGRTRIIWALLTAGIWMGHHESTNRIRRP